jgi:pilus assembly protein CpaE
LRVFEHAETVLFVMNPEIAALKAMSALVEYLNEAGTVTDKSTFVLNNMFGREILRLRDVESALGMKVEMELPYDPFLYLKAANEGIPIIIGAPQSVAAARLIALSDAVFGVNGAVMPPAAPAKKKGRFALRRR